MAIERFRRGHQLEDRREPAGPWDWGLVWEPLRNLWERGPLQGWGVDFPALDVYETEKDVVVEAELPGVEPEDVEVDVVDHQLRIRGEVRRSEQRHDRGVYRRERRFGSFVRTVSLPDEVDLEQARATMQQGVLKLRLPKKEGFRRRIPIERGG
ncbi:Hsp20/alpha crystallin family protein [Carboxydochorda subterranea]|uniref:Hsp20/alpha crystallin family protein n=1 Tax=Carboxydichorda subterranea TaxID=3109565 RepID=A0ABZ1BVU0_9FIRM|nr:Hsp20/alpha crystallin family protein [Limnochorda sp. L945t]WRP16791.1 Hsp20/alpha crystallin family protein [Limnochorda sp. L945t]